MCSLYKFTDSSSSNFTFALKFGIYHEITIRFGQIQIKATFFHPDRFKWIEFSRKKRK